MFHFYSHLKLYFFFPFKNYFNSTATPHQVRLSEIQFFLGCSKVWAGTEWSIWGGTCSVRFTLAIQSFAFTSLPDWQWGLSDALLSSRGGHCCGQSSQDKCLGAASPMPHKTMPFWCLPPPTPPRTQPARECRSPRYQRHTHLQSSPHAENTLSSHLHFLKTLQLAHSLATAYLLSCSGGCSGFQWDFITNRPHQSNLLVSQNTSSMGTHSDLKLQV